MPVRMVASSMRRAVVPVCILAVASLVASAEALSGDDDGQCGVKLVLKNPDLQEASDGFIHASGWFFIQFQAVGPDADRVKSFAFSFGKAAPDGYANCNLGGQAVTGAYILNYRGDYTPDDGFFVPINTTLVRDDEYGAAVHAYDQPNAQGREIGRFYAKARVENGCAVMGCRDKTTAEILRQDKVMPWPRVLPGDGKQTNGEVKGLTIEFAESIKEVHAYINGNETPLAPWAGVPMDDDAIPGNDNQACSPVPAPACVKRVWGPAFQSEVMPAQNEIIRVVAVDLNNNRVEKIIHLLDPTQGGIVSGDDVKIDVSVDATTKAVGTGQQGEFKFTFVSLSATEAHVNLPAEFDQNSLEGGFFPNHVVVPPGGRAHASLFLTPKSHIQDGDFAIKATPTWRSQGQDVSKAFELTLVVGKGGPVGTGAGNATANETAGAKAASGEGGVPAPGGVAVGAALMAAVVGARRRRA
ncbi:MAG: hypothetical protein HYT80_01265 [Euryarchaeota archaeon]|nr:hypothetical protein [Euryarchaeota archaeon]